MHLDEHLAGAGVRDRHLSELQDLQAAVLVVH
jgi:hypothetical protein